MNKNNQIGSYKFTALKIALIYAAIAASWILFSDLILYYFIKDVQSMTKIQMGKGWFFVFFTTLLLFILLKNECRKYALNDSLRIESDYMYQKLAESSQTGIYIHQNDKIVYANKRFADLHGYTVPELMHTNYFDLFHPEDRERAHKIKLKRLQGDQAPKRYEVKRVRKNGEAFWCETVAVRIEYRGKPAIMGNIVDISERKNTEAVILKNERYKGVIEMAGAICHELNQPMQSILGYSELLMLEIDKAGPIHAKLEKIKEQIERMGSITQKFAKITQYETVDYLQGKIVDIDRSTETP